MLDFKVVIPARFASTRLPGKPLLDIGGQPMVIRVAQQAEKSGAQQIIIATDHQTITAVAQQQGFEACMTRAEHNSGTDRIAEVATRYGWPDSTIVVNVQGDEPFIPPPLIRALAQHLQEHPDCAIATACHTIHDEASMRNPNIVKVVLDKNGNAMYFSRAPIPWPRDAYANGKPLPEDVRVFRHIGIYAYRASFLHAFGKLTPAPIEQIEALEQLRALYHGYKIGVTITQNTPPGGVDTEQDLLMARQLFKTLSEERT
jgi:3-deoxy-manno-octulosonate cytidylyltransferase (CMP-KDO synthetase)